MAAAGPMAGARAMISPTDVQRRDRPVNRRLRLKKEGRALGGGAAMGSVQEGDVVSPLAYRGHTRREDFTDQSQQTGLDATDSAVDKGEAATRTEDGGERRES